MKNHLKVRKFNKNFSNKKKRNIRAIINKNTIQQKYWDLWLIIQSNTDKYLLYFVFFQIKTFKLENNLCM